MTLGRYYSTMVNTYLWQVPIIWKSQYQHNQNLFLELLRSNFGCHLIKISITVEYQLAIWSQRFEYRSRQRRSSAIQIELLFPVLNVNRWILLLLVIEYDIFISASTPHARKNSSTSTSDGTVDSLTENEDSIGSSSGTISHNKHTAVSSGGKYYGTLPVSHLAQGWQVCDEAVITAGKNTVITGSSQTTLVVTNCHKPSQTQN